MKLSFKFILATFSYFIVVVVFLAVAAFLVVKFTGEKILQESTSSSQDFVYSELRHLVDTKVSELNLTTQRYSWRTKILADYYTHLRENISLFDFSQVENLYPEKSYDGFPGFGYVKSEWGAFADYEMRGEGSPWLPKRLVDQANNNLTFRKEIVSDLNSVMLLTPLFESTVEQYGEAIDLVWIVLDNGVSNVYPPYNYNEMIAEDSNIIDLNESKNNYFLLANPENNPERKTVWTGPYFDPFKHVWMASTVTPIYQNDEFIGVVGLDVLLKTITEEINTLKVKENGYAFLLGPEGSVLGMSQTGAEELISDEVYLESLSGIFDHPDDFFSEDSSFTELTTKKLSEVVFLDLAEVVLQILNEDRGVEEIEIANRDKLLIYGTLSIPDWHLVFVIPTDEAFAASENIRSLVDQTSRNFFRGFWLIMLLGVFVNVLVAFYVYRCVIWPIKNLTARVKRVDLNILKYEDVFSGRSDEIGELSKTFKELIEDLAVSNRQRKATGKKLEEKIAELEKINRIMLGREMRVIELKKELKKKKQDED